MTPEAVKAQLAGAQRVAPGIWIDREGHPHISIPDLLKAFGLPDTPAERALVTAIVREQLAAMYPESVCVQQDPES